MRKTQLSVLELEQRQMLSASVSLSNGVLSITADNRGDYIIAQQPTPQITEVLVASEVGKTYDFPSASVKSIVFQGGAGELGDYFANNTSLPSTQKAGANRGVNYLQGGSGNDTLVADPNPDSQTYETDAAGTNSFVGGPGFVNYFAGPGTQSFVLGSGYNGLYSILGKNTITGHATGRGYLIVNAGSQISTLPNYQIVTFFQPGITSIAGNATAPSAILQPDANGNGILYLSGVAGQTQTSFTVNQTGHGEDDDSPAQLVVTYTDPTTGTKTFTFPRSAVSWIASFGPRGSNNTIIDNSDANDVLYAGLPSAANPNPTHTLVGGKGAVSVLKGHSGTNQITARAVYDDVSAGSGTDTITLNHATARGDADEIFSDEQIGSIVRANQTKISTVINGFRKRDVLSGVPKSFAGFSDRTDTDTTPDNEDYTQLAAFLAKLGTV